MRDIYLNPTIEKLALHLGSAAEEIAVQRRPEQFRIPSNFEYYGCGALQALCYVAYGMFGIWVLVTGLEWTYGAINNTVEAYLRAVAFGIAAFAALSVIPIALKWLLIGKWKEEVIPIWSLRYFRFWLVKTLIQTAPIAAFVGSPLYIFYLRLLGMKIGRNTVVAPGSVPVCTDLISVGSNTILRRETLALGYKAQSNYIYTGPISIGDNAYVGEGSVLDINTAMEDGTQLGHASSLQAGQRVPRGRRHHGSPGQETTANYCTVGAKACTPLRRALYSAYQLFVMFGLVAPDDDPAQVLRVSISLRLYQRAPHPRAARLGIAVPDDRDADRVLVGVFGALAVGLLIVLIVPRLLYAFLREDKTYVLYGVHFVIYRIVSMISNSQVFSVIFGDSVFIPHYLKWLGYRLNKVVQTGSNFGLDQRHDIPFLCDIGSGTMVSDGLTMLNASMSNAAFKLAKVKIGDHNYLGNRIYYPAAGKTGSNCLLGTKVMVPIDGPVRENVGLLGSPCFEIPRVVDRDKSLQTVMDDATREQRIAAKTRYNIVTMITMLLGYWLFFFAVLLSGFVAILHFHLHGIFAILAFSAFVSCAGIAWFIFLERASIGFKKLTPQIVSMYDERFWRHERYWKFTGAPFIPAFKGTPFASVISASWASGWAGGCSTMDAASSTSR